MPDPEQGSLSSPALTSTVPSRAHPGNQLMLPDLHKTIGFGGGAVLPPPPPHSPGQSASITHCCFPQSAEYRWHHIVWRPPRISCDENSLLPVISSSVLFLLNVYSVKKKGTVGLFHFNLQTSLALCCCHLGGSYGQKNDAMKNK